MFLVVCRIFFPDYLVLGFFYSVTFFISDFLGHCVVMDGTKAMASNPRATLGSNTHNVNIALDLIALDNQENSGALSVHSADKWVSSFPSYNSSDMHTICAVDHLALDRQITEVSTKTETCLISTLTVRVIFVSIQTMSDVFQSTVWILSARSLQQAVVCVLARTNFNSPSSTKNGARHHAAYNSFPSPNLSPAARATSRAVWKMATIVTASAPT